MPPMKRARPDWGGEERAGRYVLPQDPYGIYGGPFGGPDAYTPYGNHYNGPHHQRLAIYINFFFKLFDYL